MNSANVWIKRDSGRGKFIPQSRRSVSFEKNLNFGPLKVKKVRSTDGLSIWIVEKEKEKKKEKEKENSSSRNSSEHLDVENCPAISDDELLLFLKFSRTRVQNHFVDERKRKEREKKRGEIRQCLLAENSRKTRCSLFRRL